MLKVKVPIIFFGTQGFSARRDGRYNVGSSLARCAYPALLDTNPGNPPHVARAMPRTFATECLRHYGTSRGHHDSISLVFRLKVKHSIPNFLHFIRNGSS